MDRGVRHRFYGLQTYALQELPGDYLSIDNCLTVATKCALL